jgi:hypothetical protein
MKEMPLEPDPIMRICYPFDKSSVMNLSLTFACPSLNASLKSKDREEHNSILRNCLEHWRARFPISYLVMIKRKQNLVIVDTRTCRVRMRHVLQGIHKDIYELCLSWKTKPFIREALGHNHPSADIDKAIDDLLASNLLLEIDQHLFALATRLRLGLWAAPPSMDNLASIGALRWRSFIEAGGILGTKGNAGPRRFCYYLLGKLMLAKQKTISSLAWRVVRLISQL